MDIFIRLFKNLYGFQYIGKDTENIIWKENFHFSVVDDLIARDFTSFFFQNASCVLLSVHAHGYVKSAVIPGFQF